MLVAADNQAELKVSFTEWSQNYEYVLLNVLYNHFLFHVSILNLAQKSPIHQVKECFSGNFSKVYQINTEGENAAIKCTTYTKKSFIRILKSTLQELLTFALLSRLKSGPNMPKVFGFDLLVYPDCIEYSMQFCRHNLNPEPSLALNLKQSLINIHSLKIIHFDIKPENICYSLQHKRYIFIDFGLHKVIKEEIGFKTETNYQGSLLFCSEEMRECFLNGSRQVDLYYNDALCLE